MSVLLVLEAPLILLLSGDGVVVVGESEGPPLPIVLLPLRRSFEASLLLVVFALSAVARSVPLSLWLLAFNVELFPLKALAENRGIFVASVDAGFPCVGTRLSGVVAFRAASF